MDLNRREIREAEMANKVVEYYRKNGFKYFIKHCIKKVLQCEQRNYDKFRKETLVTEKELQEQKTQTFSYMPKISIVVPLYKTPENFLHNMIQSVCCQSYQNWELCLSDGSGEKSPLRKQLQEYSDNEPRIRVIENNRTLNISANTNQALSSCTGDYIAFMDHDDTLEPDALFCCVEYLNKNLDADILYTDEDKISEDGKKFFQPHFKSDYNEDLLRSMNYICHLVLVRREIFQQIGKIHSEYEGAQDYDFLLRCVEKSEKIVHIPRVLYHWRAHANSTAKGVEQKAYAVDAGSRALQDYYCRNGIDAKVVPTKYSGIYRTRYELTEQPKVSIIIPNKDHIADLKKCISSIEAKAGYNNYEILVIENNSIESETFLFYDNIEKQMDNLRVLYWRGDFNYAAINNWGADHAEGAYVLFLNNDIEWLSKNFLREMLSVSLREEVGVVGSLLYYPNNTVQHAGVIIGYSGIAGHAFIGQPSGEQGYFSRIICMQNYSAVTAACMMVRKSIFDEVNGFDEAFQVAFNDIDFCLRVRENQKLIVYDPYTRAYHYESKSRGSDETPENKARFEREKRLFRSKWKKYIKDGDPYYNVNLTLERPDFAVKAGGNV